MVANNASSEKRLSYIARRVRFLQELQPSRAGVVHVLKVSGIENPADAFTKHLDRKTFRAYMARLYNVPETLIA